MLGSNMESYQLTPERVVMGLRALKAVASANAEFADEERALLASAAAAFQTEVDVDALAPVEPAEIAEAFKEPEWRLRLVQAMIVTAAIDGEASADEISLVSRFAAALGVEEPRVASLRHVLAGRVSLLRFDLMRRSPLPRRMLAGAYEKDGIVGAYRFVKAAVTGGGSSDPEVAWRYKQLGLLEDGTLGREFWRHMTAAKFAFPGEPGGLPEIAVHHDLTHVLTGYDTDQDGEVQIAAFYAGYFDEDPFSFIWMVLLMFHLGIQLNPISTPGKGHFDPAKVLAAMRRGAGINTDLTRGWNHWDVIHLPIAEVRRRYAIAD